MEKRRGAGRGSAHYTTVIVGGLEKSVVEANIRSQQSKITLGRWWADPWWRLAGAAGDGSRDAGLAPGQRRSAVGRGAIVFCVDLERLAGCELY
jgi:hypothetical protein